MWPVNMTLSSVDLGALVPIGSMLLPRNTITVLMNSEAGLWPLWNSHASRSTDRGGRSHYWPGRVTDPSYQKEIGWLLHNGGINNCLKCRDPPGHLWVLSCPGQWKTAATQLIQIPKDSPHRNEGLGPFTRESTLSRWDVSRGNMDDSWTKATMINKDEL